ncbi:MAG: glycosyltransferase family 4 protein [Gemmatimonadales bacterium]
MRVAFISHVYIDPEQRGKLRALAGLGAAIALAVPERWQEPVTGARLVASWGDDRGIRVVPIGVRGPSGPGAIWSRATIRRLLRDFRPDLVQIEEEPTTQVAAVTTGAAARLGIPGILYTAQSLPRQTGMREGWRRSRALGRAAGFLAANRLAAELLSRARPECPVDVIPQLGAPVPRRLTPIPHEGFTIGFVGRLVPERGCDLLLQACVQLLGSWHLVIVGSGPAQEELERVAERLGVASRVSWLGALPPDGLASVWSRLDCLAIPSRATDRWVEPHARMAIEAMAHGVPVVGARTGAIPEVIGDAGLVVADGDVDGLTGAIQQLRDSPSRRQGLAVEGRRRVMEEFVDAALARKTAAFWERVRSGPGSGSTA